MSEPCVHALVFKFCVQTVAEEKKIIRENAFSFAQLYTPTYRFRFSRAYIKPEPNQTESVLLICPIMSNFANKFSYNTSYHDI
jgi:hypothetical protein